ncbi:bifunctional salicylyl-CoA 5-hydroxylase/oxidoreductase [Acuticoccus sp. MNP-M23]|uniref:bifunctional salicylyl-CoA 5-hydroxylase/oxidoreductase n=1 Tax=Acuticoccus sp. MNP-M23 TaxID=3072793 RepID=UPI0028150068|nr:bifunctional salicylyl-CoA 5-hydroxylase/oxidoreductase [Acuticoccus sp. MNP-M23]WMS42626.1 bifunctional salicylyl-CoA 5-hydroxylase/oxidoreductase [Acuticoccus sp. MNP-M23]
MRIAVIGGGPAGLYFSILHKLADPAAEITIYERNRPSDTFGFGVVFSDETLQNFENHDAESYRLITSRFAYWDDVAVYFKDEVYRIGGNGFCGCSRKTLLELLNFRASQLGIEIRNETDLSIDDILKLSDECDLVVAADGINSVVREHFVEHFKPSTDLRPNHFSWMGSTRELDAFSFFFERNDDGLFIAHAYQYEPGASTWVMETDPETYARVFKDKTEEESAAYLENVFAKALDGHGLQTNRSVWRNFPMIRNERWTHGNIVLLGDAKATAHFSIGSGTKLAMEDAIALAQAVKKTPDVTAALAAFETGRREEVEKTQHSADVSLVWFERLERYWNMDPVQFAFGLMTRAKAITYDNLELRAPEFVEEITAHFARDVANAGFDVDLEHPKPPMFQPLKLRGMVLPNRVVVSPMDTYSAVDGVAQDFHLVHYGQRAMGGAGLVYTEMVCVTDEGRITKGCTGLYTDEQEAAWQRVVDFIRANSAAKVCIQLGHSGRKGSTKLMWEGMDEPLDEGAWETLAPSALPYFGHSGKPREMTRDDMDRVRDAFVAATERCARMGVDMIELHCAHGYLLASFLSPLTNHRTDAYGGSMENRLRFPLEVFDAMRAVWPAEKPMSVRVSATDWAEGGITGDDTVDIAKAFVAHGVDLIDVSTGQTVPEAKPIYGRMFQTPFAEQVRAEAKVATQAVGTITSADQINTILAAGRADLVALARPHLVNPYFTLLAAADYGVTDVDCPPQYAAGRDQAFRNAPRARQEMKDLKLKAKPRHRYQSERGQAAAE